MIQWKYSLVRCNPKAPTQFGLEWDIWDNLAFRLRVS